MAKFTLADADTVRQFAESHVDEGWDPVEVGNEDQIGNIVMDARIKGVITCPSGEVDFDYSADGDGGGYQFLVRLTRDTADGPRTITLASSWNEMRNVVASEVTGPAAVVEILETAVVEANAVVADLVAFQAAGPRALIGPTLASELAAVLSQALADADAEIRRVHEDKNYTEEDIEYAVQWRDRVSTVSAAFEAVRISRADAEEEIEPVLLMYGNPADGFRFVGPVTPNDPALDEFIERWLRNVNWWYCPLRTLQQAVDDEGMPWT